VADVGELKNKSELWKLVKTLAVQPAQAEIRFDFTIPVVATNLFIVYAAF
jgi:E3 ubiquitin-protein ligase UBR4